MKIAVCLSGLVKKYNNDTFLNNLKSIPVPYDIFCHTWDYCDTSHINLPNTVMLEKEPDINAFNNATVPVGSFKKIAMNTTPENVYRMFYSMKRCIDLVEEHESKNNFKYDFIIRSRYDVAFNFLSNGRYDVQPGSFGLNNLKLSEDEIIMPLKGDWVGKSMDLPIGHYRVSDGFYVGSEACRILHKTYDHLKLIHEKYDPPLHPERMTAYICHEFKLKVHLKNFRCDLVGR